MARDRRPRILATILVTSLALIGCTLVTLVLESPSIGVADASPVYLVAVVAAGTLGGTWPALATAVVSFLVYDFLFTEPRFTLIVADPREWLDLLVFLFVALVVGRLVSIQRARGEDAVRRAAEANSLFALSRALATAPSTVDAAPDVSRRLLDDLDLERVRVHAGPVSPGLVIADTAAGTPFAMPSLVTSLVRTPGDEPARWVRTHAPATTAPVATPASGPTGTTVHRVHIELDGVQLGELIATRARGPGDPDRADTRILALAADQLAISLRRDELRRVSTALEVARQGERLKTALIDAVSHDLRTPLSSIRATAGGLADPDAPWTDEARREAAMVIDAEATRLDRLVGGILHLGRITAGEVHPDLEPHEPWSIIEPAIDRLRPALGDRPVVVDIPDTLPPVLTDAALLDDVITNLVDNAVRHAQAPAALEVRAVLEAPGRVAIIVDDGGPGVPAEALASLFDRTDPFERPRTGARRGMGIGLSVVRGLVDAMGGTVEATKGPLGGLRVTVRLRVAPP